MPHHVAVFTKDRVNPGYHGTGIGGDRMAGR
jgi:hypothetical protein